MKKIIFLFAIIVCQTVLGQNQKMDSIPGKKEKNKFSQFYISGGVGASAMESVVTTFLGSTTFFGGQRVPGSYPQTFYALYYHFYYTSPAYNFNLDYRYTEKSFIGLAVCYQYLEDVPIAIVLDNISSTSSIYSYPQNINYQGPGEIVSRLNISARYLYTMSYKRIQGYFGIRAGISYWKDGLPNTSEFNAVLAQYGRTGFQELGTPVQRIPTIQFLAGMRFFLTPHIALHLEGGIGSPYFVEAGTTFMLDMKKIKK